jgi:hypothetical protein
MLGKINSSNGPDGEVTPIRSSCVSTAARAPRRLPRRRSRLAPRQSASGAPAPRAGAKPDPVPPRPRRIEDGPASQARAQDRPDEAERTPRPPSILGGPASPRGWAGNGGKERRRMGSGTRGAGLLKRWRPVRPRTRFRGSPGWRPADLDGGWSAANFNLHATTSQCLGKAVSSTPGPLRPGVPWGPDRRRAGPTDDGGAASKLAAGQANAWGRGTAISTTAPSPRSPARPTHHPRREG